jgi:hypothetical protein
VARTPDGRVKLLDLGLARATHRVGDDGTITDHGKTLGTPFFVSPEQARGEELDARSDIYSLGVTLFFLLTGEHPFTGATAPEVMKRHIVDPVPSIRVLRPSLSPEVDTLLQKMLAKDLKRRYQSPRELVAALDLLVSGEAGARPEPESDEEREARDPKQRRRDEKRERAEERKERAEEKRAAAGAKPKPAAHAHAAAAKAAAAPSMTSTRRLAYACAGMGGLLVLLLVIHASQRPAAADTAPRAEVADASKHAAPEAADLAKKDTLPGDFYAAKKRADEDKDGKPQEALAYWRQVFPPAERRGALKAAVEAEEAAIKAAVQQRFAADLARAAQERQEGHQRIAHRIYERVKLYGGIAEKARAEQELAKCDAEEVAAGAAGASQAAPSAKDRDTFAQMLKELAPVVLAGDYDKAVARARELAAGMAAGASQNRAEDAGKLIGELHLLDAACAKAIEELAGANLEEPLEFKLTSGKTIVGKIRAVDPDGKVAVTSQAGGYEFSIAQLSPSEKEKYATLAKGRTNDIERLLTIQSLYTGDYDDALRRAERLGMTTLLEHVRFVRDIAMPGAPAPAPKSDALVAGGPAPSRGAPAAEPDAAKPDAASSEPAAPQAAPVRPPAQPPPTSAPPPSKEPSAAPPGASKFERVFGDLLKAPVTCEKDSIFTAEYAWTPGSEETLRDWTIVKPAFKSGFTARGYQLICGAKQVARLAYKVPLAQPYDLTMTVHFEQVSEESSFLVTLGEKGGEDFAIDCGQAAYRRERGQVLQFLKRPSRPPGSMCKLRADIALKVHVDDDAVSVEWDGKKTLDGVKVKRGDGVIGLEVAGCQVDVRDLKIRAQPEPSWFLEQKAKIHD